MPDNDDNFTDISKIMYQSAEEIKADEITKIVQQKIEQITKSFEKTYQEKLEEKTKEMENKLENEIINTKKQYENQFFKKPSWFWGLIISGLLVACVFLIRYVFDKSQKNYYKLLDEKAKICDIKITNIEKQLGSLKKNNI